MPPRIKLKYEDILLFLQVLLVVVYSTDFMLNSKKTESNWLHAAAPDVLN